MTNEQCGMVRTAMYVLGVPAVSGGGAALNQAMFEGKPETLRGREDVKSIVEYMLEKAVGDNAAYHGPIAALANLLAVPVLAPLPPDISTPHPSQPVPPASTNNTPSSLPPSGDLENAFRAFLERAGVRFAANGMIGEIAMVSIGAPEGPFYTWTAASDGGARRVSGWAILPDGSVVEDKDFPRLFEGTERDGNSYSDFIEPGYEGDLARPNKTVSRYYGGFDRGYGSRRTIGPYVDYTIFEAARDWRFSVYNESMGIDPVFGSDSRDPANPFVIKVGAVMHRVKIGADGKTLEIGEVIDQDTSNR